MALVCGGGSREGERLSDKLLVGSYDVSIKVDGSVKG